MVKVKKAVFLDRDGTINEDINYLSSPEDLKLLPYAEDALKLLQDNGYLLIIITNQSGVARGYFSEETLEKINLRLEELLLIKGIKISKTYYCPHFEKSDNTLYAINCDCRKPKIGMILKAVSDFNIDLKKSALIGDKISDVQLGINADIPMSVLVKTGKGEQESLKLSGKQNVKVAENILEAANLILEKNKYE